MKNVFVLALLFSTLTNFSVNAQNRTIAKPGENVWVLLNVVKADKRQQFEKFLHEIFWAGSKKLGAADQKVFRQTRILHPTKAEKNGTYSYFFIMDPVVKGGDYDILSLLTKMYGAPKAKEYYKMFEGSVVGDQVAYRETQSKD